MKRIVPVIVLLIAFVVNAVAQNPVYFVSGQYAVPGTWNPVGSSGQMTATGFGSTYQMTTTALATGTSFFRFYSGAGASGATYGPTSASVPVAANSIQTSQSGNTSFAYGLSITSTADNIIFNAGAGAPGTAKFVVFDLTAAPATVTGVTQSPASGAVNSGQFVTIAATISGAGLVTGQGVYLRYSTDNWATSTVVAMTGSGTAYSYTMAAATASATVRYYVLTSGNGMSIAGTDADLCTINANTNSGANYSYTVGAGQSTYTYVSAKTGLWSATSTWVGGVVPPTSATTNVQIVSGHNVTQDNTVTLHGAVQVDGTLTIANPFQVQTFTGAGTINGTTNSTITVGLDGISGTFSGIISNTANTLALTKTGAGTFTLAGTNNSYSGVTTINAGTLAYYSVQNVSGGNSSLGAPTTTASGTIAMAGGTLQFLGSANSSSNRVINLTGAASIDASGTSGATLTLTGNVTPATAINPTFTGTGTGVLSGNISSAANSQILKTGTGTWTLAGTTSGVTKDPSITGGGTLIFSGSTVPLGNGSTSMNTTLAGVLKYTGSSAYGFTGWANPTITLAANSTIDASGTGVLTLPTYLPNTVTSISTAGFALTLSGTTNGVAPSAISGTGSVVKTGTGTWTLSAPNNYTGTTTISAGTLAFGVTNALPTSSPGNVVMNGGILSNNGFSGATMGKLSLQNNSTILLSNTANSLKFAASGEASPSLWASGKILTIKGWIGTPGVSGTKGQIFSGTSNSGVTALSAAQLAEIQFDGFVAGAMQLSTGEIVPSGWGITDFYINAGGSGYYLNGSGGQGSTPFDGSTIGSTDPYITDLRLYTARLSSQSICSGKMYYSVYPSVGSPATWNSVSLPNLISGSASGATGLAPTYQAASPNIRLGCGLTNGVTYKVAVYWTFAGSNIGAACPATPDVFTLDNSGNYYISTFTFNGGTNIPTLTPSPAGNICPNTSITYTAGTGSSYNWTIPGTAGVDYTLTAGTGISSSSTAVVTWLTSGSKTVTVSYSNGTGCTYSVTPATTVTTTVNALAVITGTASICSSGGTTTLTTTSTPFASNPWSYTAGSGTATLGTNTTNSMIVTGGTAGSVGITFKDINGCSSASYPVTVNALPTISNGSASVCNGSTTPVFNGSGTAFSPNPWAVTAGTGTATPVTNTGTTTTITGATAGTVSLTYKDNNGCISTGYNITVNALPTISNGSAGVCNGSNTPVFNGSGVAFSPSPWTITPGTGTATLVTNTGTITTITGTGTGTVSLTYKDNNGCISTGYAVTVNALPTISNGSAGVCNGSTTPVFNGSGTAFSPSPWAITAGTGTATLVTNTGTTTTITGATPGTVSLTYKDNNGCISASYGITVRALPAIANGAASVCNNSTTPVFNGSGVAFSPNPWILASGTGSATLVTNTGTSTTVTGSTAGTVSLTYKDNNGCISAGYNITVNALPTISNGSSSVCSGSTTPVFNGSAVAFSPNPWTLTAGTGTASLVTNTGTTTTITGGTAGTVSLTYKDNNSCVSTGYTITVNALPIVYGAGTNTSICTSSAGTVTLNATNPAVGTGTWSVSSGPSLVSTQFANTGINNTVFTPAVTIGVNTYVLQWAITNGACTTPATSTVTISVSTPGTWLGGTSSEWNTASNWSCSAVPISTTNVIIPSGTTFSPVISTAPDAVANSVTINNLATLSMSASHNLSITSGGSIANNGTFTAGTGTVVFLGTGSISGSSTTAFNNLTLNGSTAFNTAPAINGTLLFNSLGASVSGNSPTYACSSTLEYYNLGNAPGTAKARGQEWTTASSGAGYPGNVYITGTSYINGNNSGNNNIATCGNLTIDNGSGLYMDYGGTGNSTLTVHGNITISGKLSLGNGVGGDLYLFGNYTVASTTNINFNTRAVQFIGTGTQVITYTGGGTANFNGTAGYGYFVVNKTAGNVQLNNSPATSVLVSNTGLGALQIINTGGGLDLNGQTFTLAGSGATVLVSGNAKTITGSAGSILNITGNETVTSAAGGTLITDVNVKVITSASLDCGAALTTINGILQLNGGSFVYNNSPYYGTSSLLIYNTANNSSTPYNRNSEWNGNITSSAVGFPNNVQISNNTYVLPGGASHTATNLNMGGNLTIDAGSTFDMSYNGATNMTLPLKVAGNITIAGTLIASQVSPGDVYVSGNWTRTGTFTDNSRAVFFDGARDGIITATGGQVFPYVILTKTNTTNKVSLADSVTITQKLTLSKGTFDLVNKNLTIVSTRYNTASIAAITPANLVLPYSGTGKFVIQRFFPARRAWRLLAVPLKNLLTAPTINQAWQEGAVNTSNTVPGIIDPSPLHGTLITGPYTGTDGYAFGFDPGTQPNSSIYYFNGSAWRIPNNTTGTIVTTNPGYMLFVRGNRHYIIGTQYTPADTTTLDPKGQINVGDTTVTAITSGFKLIGNPYASAFNFGSVTQSGLYGVDAAHPYLYEWDAGLTGIKEVGAIVTLGWTGSHYTCVPAAITPIDASNNLRIESGSAFLVKFGTGGGSVTMHETDKTATNALVFRPADNSPEVSLRTNLYAYNGDGSVSLNDGVLNLFNESYSNAVDNSDATKFGNVAENLILRRNGIALAIETRKPLILSDSIYYNLTQLSTLKYRLEFIGTNLQAPGLAFLEDTLAHVSIPINLSDTNNYYFTIPDAATAIKSANRFRIVFREAAASPVPVTFKNIEAKQQSDNSFAISIKWNVTNELNVQQYVIEKSVDGKDFSSIGSVKVTGNNQLNGNYAWLDGNGNPGSNFYRIKSIDVNGAVQYSTIAKVDLSMPVAGVVIYPNPVSGGIVNMLLNNMLKGIYGVRVLNAAGQLMAVDQFTYNGGNAVQRIRIKNYLAGAVYTLELAHPNKSTSVFTVIAAVE